MFIFSYMSNTEGWGRLASPAAGAVPWYASLTDEPFL